MDELNDRNFRYVLLQDMIVAHHLTTRDIAEDCNVGINTVRKWNTYCGSRHPIPIPRLLHLISLYPTTFNHYQLPDLKRAA